MFQSIDESASPDIPEGVVPKSESTYSIEIPNSLNVWKVKPRPLQSGDVSLASKRITD